MGSIHDVLRIEEFEAALARGESPKHVLRPLTDGVPNDRLLVTMRTYLLFATGELPAPGEIQDLDDELLRAAFKAAVRQKRVDDDDIEKLHLKAEVEAANARLALAKAEKEVKKTSEFMVTQAEFINELEGRIFRQQDELLSLRGKYARSVQTISGLRAKLAALTGDGN